MENAIQVDCPPSTVHDAKVNIIGTIAPIFGLIVIGYVLGRIGAFRANHIGGIARYVFTFALPVLLFDSMATIQLPGRIQWGLLAGYYLPTLTLFLACLFVARRLFNQSRAEMAVFAIAGSYSNGVGVGLPLVTAVWAEAGLVPWSMIIAIHAAIMFTATTVIAEGRGGAGSVHGMIGRSMVATIRNPILGGLILGLLFNFSGLALGGPIEEMIGLIRGSALPAALFVTGAALAEYRVTQHLSETVVLVVVKLFVHPFLVWLVAFPVLRLPPLWGVVAVTIAALPTGINASVFARKYDANIGPVAAATLISTLLSVATLTVILSWFEGGL